MGFSLAFCVSSLSPLPLEGFSIKFGQVFISVRWFAEPMTRVRRLEFKVTIKVMGFNLAFHVGSISPLPLEGFSFNVGQMSVRW